MGGNIFADLRAARARERARQAALPLWRRVAEFVGAPFMIGGALNALVVLSVGGNLVAGWKRWRSAINQRDK